MISDCHHYKEVQLQMLERTEISFSEKVDELTEKIKKKDSQSGLAAIELANLLNNGGLHDVCVLILFRNKHFRLLT